MIVLPIVYDRITGKSGFVIPFNVDHLKKGTGVCRYFYTTNSPNDWQSLHYYDEDFLRTGEISISDPCVISAIEHFKSDNLRDIELQKFYRSFAKFDKDLGIYVFNRNWTGE